MKKHPKRWIALDANYPEPVPESAFVTTNWDDFYPGAAEKMPPSMPKPRGKHVVITCYCDADHASNRLTRRSHTGILIFVNKSPITFYSKRQNTVESSSFGSEFIAMRIAVDLIEALRYKLRMFGVPLSEDKDKPDDPLPAIIFGDNQSVITNMQQAMSKLNKKHNEIAFHRVREAVAAGWIRTAKVLTTENLADVLTKSLPAEQRNYLVDHVLL